MRMSRALRCPALTLLLTGFAAGCAADAKLRTTAPAPTGVRSVYDRGLLGDWRGDDHELTVRPGTGGGEYRISFVQRVTAPQVSDRKPFHPATLVAAGARQFLLVPSGTGREDVSVWHVARARDDLTISLVNNTLSEAAVAGFLSQYPTHGTSSPVTFSLRRE